MPLRSLGRLSEGSDAALEVWGSSPEGSGGSPNLGMPLRSLRRGSVTLERLSEGWDAVSESSESRSKVPESRPNVRRAKKGREPRLPYLFYGVGTFAEAPLVSASQETGNVVSPEFLRGAGTSGETAQRPQAQARQNRNQILLGNRHVHVHPAQPPLKAFI